MDKLIFSLLFLFFICVHVNGQGYIKRAEQSSYIVSPLPQDYIKDSNLPSAWDWRNISTINMVTWSRNQHIPQYCGSCWAFGTTSALSDRIAIGQGASFPEVNLAPQHLVDCEGGGDCDGGDPGAAYQYIKTHGIPDETCKPYQAKNGLDCTPVCKTCWGSNCAPIKNYKLWKVKEYGSIAGASNMKKEIMARGPIACGIDATAKFEKYSGGIYKEDTTPYINHVISVVGWGSQDGVDYWIGRNSWGTYWGETGWFRIVVGPSDTNLGIETDCYWATPLL